FLVAREACRMFAAQNRGLFIALPGLHGRSGVKNGAAQTASKFAVTGMLKSMAQEFQRNGVRFCLLHFGAVDTPLWDGLPTNLQPIGMSPVGGARNTILPGIDSPSHLVLSEVVLHPEGQPM